MMVKVGTPARYMAMAAPDLMEWVPISEGLKPSLSSPRSCAAERSFERTVVEVIVLSLPLTRMVLTVESSFVPGQERTLRTTDAQDLTGQRRLSPDLCIVTDSCLSSLFWNSKVMEKISAREI